MSRTVSFSFVRSSRVRSGWVAVSTVLLPMTHWNGDYETMVFEASRDGRRIKSYRDLACRRYWQLSEADKGHAEVVAAWERRKPNRVPPPAPRPRIVVTSRAA